MPNGRLSPFYVHPGGEFGPGLAGLGQTLMQAGEIKRQRQREQEVAEKFAKMKQGAIEAFRSGDPDKIAEFSLANPEMSEALIRASEHKNKRTEENYKQSLVDIFTNPTEENVRKVIENRQRILGEEEAADTETSAFLEAFRENPEKAKQLAEATFASKYPKEFTAMKKAMLPATGQKLPSSIQGYNLAKKEGFEGDYVKFKQVISGKGPMQELEMMKLQTQIADIQERIQARQTAKEEKKQMKEKKTKTLVTGIDSVIDDIDKAISLTRGTTTGLTGLIYAKKPGSPAHLLRSKIKTIQANLGLDKLNQMKEASATGASGLGPLTERELADLRASIADLDPLLSDEELIKNFEKIKRHYNNWKRMLIEKTPQEIKAEGTPAEERRRAPTGAPGAPLETEFKPVSEMTDEELEAFVRGE